MMICVPSSRPDHPTAKGLLLPLLAALGIFGFTVASITLLPKRLGASRVDQNDVVDLSAGQGRVPWYQDLVDPHNGDNGTNPAQTTTDECADVSLPVLAGVDVVAYFSLEQDALPIQGKSSYMTVYGEYVFYFSSMKNLRTFEDEPLKYIPAWGGFCSYGIANEPVWTGTTLGPFGDPKMWTILPDGRLHVFRSPVPRLKFAEDAQGNIERGNAVWRDWFGEKAGPLNSACICAAFNCDDQ